MNDQKRGFLSSIFECIFINKHPFRSVMRWVMNREERRYSNTLVYKMTEYNVHFAIYRRKRHLNIK